MELSIENDEITWEDKEVAYVREPADDYEEPLKYIVQGQEPTTEIIEQGYEYQLPQVAPPGYYAAPTVQQIYRQIRPIDPTPRWEMVREGQLVDPEYRYTYQP